MGKVKASEDKKTVQSVNQVSQDEQKESGDSSSNFVDNSPQALEAKKLQEMADGSEETAELEQLQETATAHDNSQLNQEVTEEKKENPDSQETSLKDFVDEEPEHDPSKVLDTDIKATVEYNTWEESFVSKEDSLYSETELLLACRLTIRELREKGAAPKSIVSLGEQYLIQAQKQGTVADKAIGFEGELEWHGQGGGMNHTDFGKWIVNGGPEPNKTSSVLNCWELVLYSAFKGGVLAKSRITSLYTKFNSDLKGPKDVEKAFKNFDVLKKGSEYVYDKDNPDSPKPIKGDMVIFKDFPTHVTIATGDTTAKGEVEIMSLWTQNGKKTYKTTVEELLVGGAASPVKFFTPNW